MSKKRQTHKPTWLPTKFFQWLVAPQPIVRLEFLRIVLPLAILGFMSSRLWHADHWLSVLGYQMPDMGGGDYRQPVYFAPLPVWGAWALAGTMLASGLSTAAGFFTRPANWVFAACLFYVALADRLAAFTVSKMGAVLMLALCFTPAGMRYSVDAWRRMRAQPTWQAPQWVSGGCVRFFQLLLVVMYTSSGWCKARGDWLSHSHVLWTHLYDSYQTPLSFFMANILPAWSWTLFQGITLAFEALAPLWFALAQTRPWALAWGVAMHTTIGLTFGPVVWFSLLMIGLLVGGFAQLPKTLQPPSAG